MVVLARSRAKRYARWKEEIGTKRFDAGSRFFTMLRYVHSTSLISEGFFAHVTLRRLACVLWPNPSGELK